MKIRDVTDKWIYRGILKIASTENDSTTENENKNNVPI